MIPTLHVATAVEMATSGDGTALVQRPEEQRSSQPRVSIQLGAIGERPRVSLQQVSCREGGGTALGRGGRGEVHAWYSSLFACFFFE